MTTVEAMVDGLKAAGIDPDSLSTTQRDALVRLAAEVENPELADVDVLSKMVSVLRTVPKKVGPNAKCPCGSGKKFKKCCRR